MNYVEDMTQSEMKKLRELVKRWRTLRGPRGHSGCAIELTDLLDAVAVDDSPDSPYQRISYNQGWHNACSAVADAITVLTLSAGWAHRRPTRSSAVRLDKAVLAAHVMRVCTIVTEVYRRKA